MCWQMKLLPVLALVLLPLTPLSAQTDPGQTIAGIKTASDPLTVENGLEQHVTIRSADIAVSVPSAEALHIADWLKRAENGNYGENTMLKLARTGGAIVVLLTPPDGPSKELRLTSEAAGQFANALATASQNVSPQATNTTP